MILAVEITALLLALAILIPISYEAREESPINSIFNYRNDLKTKISEHYKEDYRWQRR